MSSRTWSKTDDGRTSPDGRWTATPYFREARRGGNDKVQDGWILNDTFNGTTRRYDTYKNIDQHVERTLRDEEKIAELPSVTVERRFPSRRNRMGYEATFRYHPKNGDREFVSHIVFGSWDTTEADYNEFIDRLLERTGHA